jgi:outer membrane protein assembly factor BamB
VDTSNGEVVWSDRVGWHAWSSPVVVDETLVVATCAGEIRGYSIRDPRSPTLAWAIGELGGTCIESTPAIWDGTIYVGARDGLMRAFR